MYGRCLLLAACVTLALGVQTALADRRVALIIGNGAYEHADKLANPVTDSRNLREALKKIGFGDADIVYGENLNKRDLERAIGRFAVLARDADVALTYYAGHGATFGDTPYIVPVDARFESIDQMPYELEPLENMIGELRKAKGVRIAIVDACRDNGAERDLKRTNARGGEISRGLAPVRNPDGLILAYATQYLATAADGPSGGDSPFTAALLKYLPTPGLDVKDLFFAVGREVLAQTKGQQRPEVKVSFYDQYALVAPGVAVVPVPQSPPVLAPPALDKRQAAFDAAMQADTPDALSSFVDEFSKGPLADIARRERDRLTKQAALPPAAVKSQLPDKAAALPAGPAPPTLEASTSKELEEMLNQFQRRADLVLPLIAVVQSHAKAEKDVMKAVVDARAQVNWLKPDAAAFADPEKFRAFEAAQSQLFAALAPLLALSEKYPALNADQKFVALLEQLEGTGNRIAVARRDYGEAVKAYRAKYSVAK